MFRLLFWGLMGGLVAVPLDALHVVTGVLSYRDPVLGLQDWWVIPLFVSSGLLLGFSHRHIAVPLSAQQPAGVPLWAAGLGLCALVFAYASSGVLQTWPVAALAVYVGVFVVALVAVDRRARSSLLLHGIGAAIVGPLVEIGISSTGAFSYAHPDVAGVALWLPGIYLNAAVASHLMDRHLLARGI